MTYKILAVDDHPQTLDIVLLTLQQNGYQTVGLSSPLEAVATAEKEKPDLVLLDMNMPEIDGKEVCRRLRAHPQLGDIPIIMFSAESSEKLASFEVGADDFLVKPTDPDELIFRIDSLLSSRTKAGSIKSDQSGVKEGVPSTKLHKDSEMTPPVMAAEPQETARHLIGVMGVRGGSGTTTMAINLAVSAAVIGYSTTLIDLDVVQGHIGLYLNVKGIGGVNAMSQLSEEQLALGLPEFLVPYKNRQNLNLLLANPNLRGYQPVPSPRQMASVTALITHSRQFVVADLGHEITPLTRTILDGAHQVVICLRPERVALTAARDLIGQLKETLFAHTVLSIVVVGTIGGMKLQKRTIEQFLGYPLVGFVPALPNEMIHAMNKGVAYVQLFPQNKVTKLFRLLVKQLVKSKKAEL